MNSLSIPLTWHQTQSSIACIQSGFFAAANMSQRQELVNLAYKKYEAAGGANKKLSPVIFLHGCTGSKEMWLDLPEVVAEKTKRTVYALDARNHGDSAWNDFFNFDINVDDLLHTMDALSITKAVLVGHSMGGVTALRTALRAPERVELIIVEDMFAKKFDQDILKMIVMYINLFKEAIKRLPRDTPEDQALVEVMKYISSKVPESSRNLLKTDNITKLGLPIKRDSDGTYLFKSNIDVIAESLKNGDTLMSEAEGSYSGPAYFIYGSLSPFQVNEDDSIQKLFPNAELIGVEGADHSIHIQFTEEFTELLLKYIPH